LSWSVLEAHALPVQGSSAEEAVRHRYLSSAEMTHKTEQVLKWQYPTA